MVVVFQKIRSGAEISAFVPTSVGFCLGKNPAKVGNLNNARAHRGRLSATHETEAIDLRAARPAWPQAETAVLSPVLVQREPMRAGLRPAVAALGR
jgi:hypothetical protein